VPGPGCRRRHPRRSRTEHFATQVARCASLTVVELTILINKEDASVRRDAFGYVGLAALLEEIGSSPAKVALSGFLLTMAPETTTAQ
jgi:hypothetical protein